MKKVVKTTLILSAIVIAGMIITEAVATPEVSDMQILLAYLTFGFSIATFVFGIKCILNKAPATGWIVTILSGLLNLVWLISFATGVLLALLETV